MKPFKKYGVNITLDGTENDVVPAASFGQSQITMSLIVVMMSLEISDIT